MLGYRGEREFAQRRQFTGGLGCIEARGDEAAPVGVRQGAQDLVEIEGCLGQPITPGSG